MAMDLRFTNQLAVSNDVRHQVRHLGWFRRSFVHCVDLAKADWGIAFKVNEPALANAFFDWAIAFSGQRQHAELSRKDFAIFAAGMLLKELIRGKVCSAENIDKLTIPADANQRMADIIRFWPEGFLYTSYCLSVLKVVMLQDFETDIEIEPAAEDLRTWWSFRENTSEDVSLAIGFLDTFVGSKPNWVQPEFVLARQGMRAAEPAAAVLETVAD